MTLLIINYKKYVCLDFQLCFSVWFFNVECLLFVWRLSEFARMTLRPIMIIYFSILFHITVYEALYFMNIYFKKMLNFLKVNSGLTLQCNIANWFPPLYGSQNKYAYNTWFLKMIFFKIRNTNSLITNPYYDFFLFIF